MKAAVRHVICLLIGAVLLALSFLAEAQQPKKVYQIGILHSESDSNPNSEHNVATLRQRLRELGYFEGQNVHFEYRWAEGKRDRLAELAADLLRHNVDVLVTTGTPAVRVAKQATRSVPIVMAQVGDAVENGIVASLARPGGNITGVSFMNPEIQSKWLELVTEASPKIRRVAVLVHPDNLNRPAFKAMAAAAGSLGLELYHIEVLAPEDVDRAFSATAKLRADAVTVFRDSAVTRYGNRIAEFAAKRRLPTIGPLSQAEVGFLIGYGASGAESYRRAAYFVDRILKGAKPADLPVEQPMKFELVINLKTAKQIGLTIPPNLLVRADRVIK
jgi:ABC-type uncharacterized transport system substrate-binding protein